ncbi:hypothetical protein [Parapedobacter tibetensis]|uniref:hypothetical protein n=1 Tax=Parapedobacter tibetensis TaxID=2972951 RepID=UPI00214D799E|nr:hypothetical protein [Parapedobacter tibetensis]
MQKVGADIKKLYDAQKEAVTWIPGTELIYDALEYSNGQLTLGEAMERGTVNAVLGMAGGNLVKKGTQLVSKTIWKGKGKARIDVENPNPASRPRQVHYQDNDGNKYIYDPSTGLFKDAPDRVNKLLNDSDFKKGIEKGLRYLGFD